MTSTRILVVDDEIIIARELEARLVALGYQVLGIASTGRGAVELTERSKPDLVLMDIVLRGDMDGIEAAAEIRMRWGIPVIYVTAFADEATLLRAKITEPFGYIVKPFSERELRANIEMALYKHQAEAKLMAIEKWFNTSMHEIEDGVVVTDAEGNITFINQVAEILTGWKGHDAIGRKVSETIPFVCRSCTQVPGILEPTNGGLIVKVDGDVLLRNRRGGGDIPIHLALAPLRDRDGNALGTVMVMRDLSEQRLTTRILREIEEQRTQSQRLETASLMAGGIAQHFNNLLSVILSQTLSILGQTLFQLDNSKLSEDYRESVKQIKQAAERVTWLTSQLLTISGRKAILPTLIDLNELVVEKEEEIRHYIGKDIVLNTSLSADLRKVRADSGQIRQVIKNLVLNAKNAMPQGGSLNIETANIELGERMELDYLELSSEPQVMLAVSDTGHGMSREVRTRVFEPFFTTQDVSIGEGLGLSIVYGIVKQSGGDIAVESEPGLGSTFRVYLPAVEDQVVVEDTALLLST